MREWAKSSGALIISVDYTLAPDAKYPYALDECFYVYEWLVSGKNQLGILPSKIILAGDSAGGNFVLGVTFKVRYNNYYIHERGGCTIKVFSGSAKISITLAIIATYRRYLSFTEPNVTFPN